MAWHIAGRLLRAWIERGKRELTREKRRELLRRWRRATRCRLGLKRIRKEEKRGGLDKPEEEKGERSAGTEGERDSGEQSGFGIQGYQI